MISSVYEPTGLHSMTLQEKIFGSVVNVGGGLETVLFQALSVWTVGVMALAGMMFFYVYGKALLHTAHEGNALGKQNNSHFMPLRTLLGAALILPIGFGATPDSTALQNGLGMLVRAGSGLGDAVWSRAIDAYSLPAITPKAGNSRKLAASVLLAEVCAFGAIENGQKTYNTLQITSRPVNRTSANGDVRKYLKISFGEKAICGETTLPVGIVRNNTFGLLDLTKDLDVVVNNAAGAAMPAAFNKMKNDLKPLAKKLTHFAFTKNPTAKFKAEDIQKFENIRRTFDKSLQAAAAKAWSVATGNNAIADQAKREGWIAAGSWFIKLNAIQDSADGLALSTLEPVRTDWTRAGTKLFGEEGMKGIISVAAVLSATLKEYEGAVSDGSKIRPSGNESLKWWDAQAVSEYLTEFFTGVDADKDPILAIRNFGTRVNILTVTLGGFALANEALQGAAAANPIVNIGQKTILAATTVLGIGAAATVAKSVAYVISNHFGFIVALAALGFIASTAIPMLSYTFFLFFLVAYLTAIVVAMAAAPLVAVAYMMEGDDAHGKASDSYKFIANILFMPALGIIGLVGSMLIFQAVAGFMLGDVYSALSNMRSGDFNILGMIDNLFFIFAVLFGLAWTSASLITQLPDKVLSFIGGGSGGGDNHGADSNIQQTNAIISGGHSKAAGGLGGGNKNGIQTKSEGAAENKVDQSVGEK